MKKLIGQEKIQQTVEISLAAAKKQQLMFPHSIMTGPPGYGKTTLAHMIAKEMGGNLKEINGATIKSRFELICMLASMEEGDIIFIDEIHSADKKSHETLYTAMEGSYVNYSVAGDEELNKCILKPFTLLAATTCTVPKPLLDRFTHNFQFVPYSDTAIAQIISNIDSGIPATDLVPYCRSNPRVAKKRIKWLKDFCCAKEIKKIDGGVIEEAMHQIDISKDGLTLDDRLYLDYLKRNKARSGMTAIANGTGLSKRKITEEIEPFLLQQKYIMLSSGGRILLRLPQNP